MKWRETRRAATRPPSARRSRFLFARRRVEFGGRAFLFRRRIIISRNDYASELSRPICEVDARPLRLRTKTEGGQGGVARVVREQPAPEIIR